MARLHGRLATLCELLRLPNLFTVPGDVLVGWCLSGQRGGPPVLAVAASLCLYAGGLLLNDACDAGVDAVERPQRPIPSGRIGRGTVLALAALCFGAGVLAAWSGWRAAVALLAAIVAYDAVAKHIPGVGVATMGLCRGLNVWLGVACSWPAGEMPWPPMVWAASGFFFVYITVVSVVARNEAQPKAKIRPWLRWLPMGLALATAPLFRWFGYGPYWPSLAAAGALLPLTLARRLVIPRLVAGLIRFLVPLQLLWCLQGLPPGAYGLPALLLGLWAGAWIASGRFEGS